MTNMNVGVEATHPVGGTILVVDDEVGPRESLRLILTPDFDVQVAADGREAIDLFEQIAPDVVLSDIRMPKMDGVELMKAIRQRSADVPFILITGYASVESAQEAVRAGAFDYISKPYNVGDIRALVAKALEAGSRNTERERMVERLRSANEQLEARMRDMDQRASVGDLSAEVIHDLNNPICALQGYVELLEHTLDEQSKLAGGEETELLRTIKRQAQRCIELTRNFMNYARPDGESQRSALNINELIESVLSLFQARLRHLNITLQAIYDPDLPDIRADSVPLQQVFYNLVANACQAMESHDRHPHVLRVETRKERTEDGKTVVEAVVKDNGPGIPADVQDRIFDRFFTTKPKHEGTGLGLAICKRVIAAHDGVLAVHSKEGEGTEFAITVPAHTLVR